MSLLRLRSVTSVLLLTSLPLLAACSSDDDSEGSSDTSAAAIEDYAALVEDRYAAALDGAEALQAAIDAFVDEPSEDGLRDARQAWLDARDPYGLTEAFRFYDGPIDNTEDGPEGFINAWPVDEALIDYVVGSEGEPQNGGIVNETGIDIDEETLLSLNDGEDSITTGYHAIEFLLWGQDLSETGPGDRPYTDYVVGEGGTAENQERRGQYLKLVASLLVRDLRQVHEAWLPDETNYRADFVSDSAKASLGKIFQGIRALAGTELSGERMYTAYENKDQEDEHSCFSDNTLNDLRANAESIQLALTGRYGDFEGPGVVDVVRERDADLADRLEQQIEDSIELIEEIPAPFDQTILESDDSEGRQKILEARDQLLDFADSVDEAAELLGLKLELE